MGFWSMTMASGWRETNSSQIRLLFPEPATPDTAVSTPLGMSASTFFRLWSFAPRMGKLSVQGRGLGLGRTVSRRAAAVRVSACFSPARSP